MVESTASWYWLADLLEEEGVELTLAHSKLVKAIAYAKVKTDAVDAHTLAQLLRVDLIPRAHMISPELRGVRDVLRVRLRLVQKRSRCPERDRLAAGQVQRALCGGAAGARPPGS